MESTHEFTTVGLLIPFRSVTSLTTLTTLSRRFGESGSRVSAEQHNSALIRQPRLQYRDRCFEKLRSHAKTMGLNPTRCYPPSFSLRG